MKPELERLCAAYIANRDEIRKAFRWEDNAVHSVCANVFCACGGKADADRLKACRKVIKKHTRPFSRFRGKVRTFLSCMLSLGNDPDERMTLANDYYRLLRQEFKGTEYLVLAAFLLTELTENRLTEEQVARGKEIFRLMNSRHRFLTNNTDSVFAMLLAYSEKSGDELVCEMESCYKLLKTRFSGNGDMQTVSQVLSMASGTPEEKAQRVIDLYDALLEADVRYGRSSEMAPLAALSLADTPVSVLVEEIKSAYEFLAAGKEYGSKDTDKEQCAMHAVMIVSDQYAGTRHVNSTVMTNTLEMLFAKQKASRVSLLLHVLEFAGKIIAESKEHAEKTETDTSDAAGTDQPGKE